MKSSRGFTLVEILVAVAIVAVLATVITVRTVEVNKKNRDVERQGDLVRLQAAVELYKQKNGRYPAGCRGDGVWSGQAGTFACAGGSNHFIVGLAPEFIPAMPSDPRPNPAIANSGYVYWSSADNVTTSSIDEAGSAYKLMVSRTVEAESVTETHRFRPCDVVGGSGVCGAVHFNHNNVAPKCDQDDATNDFETSYAVWGGYPYEPFPTSPTRREEQLENTICRMP